MWLPSCAIWRCVKRFQFIKVCAGKNNIRHYSRNFDIYAITSETIWDSAECYAGLSVRFESSAACIWLVSSRPKNNLQLKGWVQNHAKWRSQVFFFYFAKVPEILHVVFNWIETHHPVFFLTVLLFVCEILRMQKTYVFCHVSTWPQRR